jgi:glutamate racemase
MQIGIFDSGLGGLLILKNIIKRLPRYDFLYLGDTKRVPYGNRSQETIYQFTKKAVDYLFSKNCRLIILACNTASAQALRKIQKEYLLKNYPSRRVLGVIIPTIEATMELKNIKKVGVLATPSTVASQTFIKEFNKSVSGRNKIKVFQQSSPLLVPLVENNGLKWADPILKEYLKPLLAKKVEAIILGCTHYPVLKNKIRQIVGKKIAVISQDEIIPAKLLDYLERHSQIETKLGKNSKKVIAVTDITDSFRATAKKWFGRSATLRLVNLD